MKIARLRDGGSAFWAVIDPGEGTARAIQGAFAQWAPWLTAGRGADALQLDAARSLDGLHFLPPVEPGSQVFVVGANYLTHLASDFKIEPPKEPAAFLKSSRAVIGAYDDITYPPLTEKLDFEIELVAVIGAPVVNRERAIESVLGYTVGNDVSARDLQKGSASIGMDLFSAKSLDRSTPVGPWIVTRDEFGDAPADLRMTLAVNGETRQDDRTTQMRWHVAQLLAFVDARVALAPGDIMFTGTPAGVGNGDGRFLKPGDVLESTIERIGTMKNRVGARAG